jgi:23S rRNA (cytosine1962-C5)-methyltransferase
MKHDTPPSSSQFLSGRLSAAFSARKALLSRCAAEGTTAYRLFHGSAEGCGGLTIDRYGEVLLIQSFHRTLEDDELAEIVAFYAAAQPGLLPIYNDRSSGNSRISNTLSEETMALAEQPRTVSECGVNYRFRARHAGQDPWLFLDLRAARRRVMQEAKGKSVLNLFAYTCGVGIAAAVAGAREVINIDFSESALAVGKENAGLNRIPISVRFIRSDFFPAVRQYAGLGQSQVVRRKKLPDFPKLVAQKFDLVFLDPPRHAKSAFGVVDLVNDYAAVFKPALLATAEGGTLYCCNNVGQVDRLAWLDQLERSARKAGRPVREAEWIVPEEDFPSYDGNPPLKVLRLSV